MKKTLFTLLILSFLSFRVNAKEMDLVCESNGDLITETYYITINTNIDIYPFININGRQDVLIVKPFGLEYSSSWKDKWGTKKTFTIYRDGWRYDLLHEYARGDAVPYKEIGKCEIKEVRI